MIDASLKHDKQALVDNAMDAHKRGWALTPLDGKVPILKGWQKLPKPTEGQIRAWVQQGFNIGVRAGAASGIVIVDDDSQAGWVCPVETVTAITGKGRAHYYFAMDSGRPVKNSASLLAEKVDIRGEGGQCVFPGSIHPETNKPYEWMEGYSPSDIALAPFPYELLEEAEARRQQEKQSTPQRNGDGAHKQADRLKRYVSEAVQREANLVASATKGTRNDQLNRSAFSLGTLVGAGAISEAEVHDALLPAAVQCGLKKYDAQKTIESGLNNGMQNPRVLPETHEGNGNSKPKQADKAEDVLEVAFPKIITAAQLQTMEFEPPREIIAGLVLEGLVALGAKPKKGKSWLMLLAALAVACGWQNAFGMFQATKSEVLYLALEDSERRIKSRMAPLLGSAPWPANLSFCYSWRRLDKGGLTDADAYLTQHPDCKLFVIDTYTRIKPPKGRNADSYAEDAAWTAALQEIALKHHCAIVLVLHQRKAASEDPFDTISGTLGTTASADLIMVLERTPKSGDGTLTVTGRDIEEKAYQMRFDSGVWTCLGEADSEMEPEDPLEGAKDFLREILKDGPVLSEEIFAEGLSLGFKKKKLFEAKEVLHVKASKKGFQGAWGWELPFCVTDKESLNSLGNL